MDNTCDFLVESPFIRSMIINNDRYAFDIIDISGSHEGRLNLLLKAVRGITYNRLVKILEKSAKENIVDTFVLVFYLRDCRGGKGERVLGRKALQWLAINYPDKFAAALKILPEYGRWDDVFCVFPNVILLDRMDNYLSTHVDINAVQRLQQLAVKLFASRLQQDVVKMESHEKISLAAKWAPTENDKNDQQFEMVDVLCKELKVSKSQYRKRIISPLRKYLKLVEHSFQGDMAGSIEYSKIPNVAFQKYYRAFMKRDNISFGLYLKNTQIENKHSSTPFPHDILQPYDIFNTNEVNDVIEDKWSYFLKHHVPVNMQNMIPILHTGMSFYDNKDMFLKAISLALFVCRQTKKPFHNLIIKNHKTTFHYIPTDEKVFTSMKKLTEYSDEENIDIIQVMKKIIENAKANHVASKDLPSTLLYICDTNTIKKQMSTIGATKTKTIQTIQNIFEDAGYEMPKIVFFNMNAESTSFPILSNHHNVGMISGYSPNVLNSILYTENELFTCKTILNNILYKNRYQPLRNLIK